MRRCGERAGWVLPSSCCQNRQPDAVVALVGQLPGVGEPLPQRGQLGASGRGVEVADDDAGLHRAGVQLGQGGHLGGPVAAVTGSGA